MLSEKSNIAYELMKKLITSKKWAPGEKHSVLEVSQKLKMSRSPVSEAVKLLASQGFVKLLPRKGFEVSSFDNTEMQTLLEIKMVLEALAASKAALNESVERKEELIKLLKAQKESIDNNDKDKAAELDQELHFKVFNLTDSPMLEKMITELWHQGHYYSDWLIDEKELAVIYKEHVELVDAIVSSNPDKASKASKKHNKRYMSNILAKIEKLDNVFYEDIKKDMSIGEMLLTNASTQK